MRLLIAFALALCAFPCAANGPQAQTKPVRVAQTAFAFNPQSGRLAQGGAMVPRSFVFADTKTDAFLLKARKAAGEGPEALPALPARILKIHEGRGYKETPDVTPETLAAMADNEARLLNDLSAIGAAPEVLEQGQLEDGTRYSVLRRPRGAVSVSYLVKKGRYAEIEGRMRELARRLLEQDVILDRLDPTQLVALKNGILVIKGREEDRRQTPGPHPALEGDLTVLSRLGIASPENLADPAVFGRKLLEYYAERLSYIEHLSRIYPAPQGNAPPLSTGERTTNRLQVAAMVLEAIRSRRTLRLIYVNREGQRKTVHALPLKRGLTYNGFLKGSLEAVYFPENRPWKAYGLRLERILQAEFLPKKSSGKDAAAEPRGPPISDEKADIIANSAARDKGAKIYKATLKKAQAYLEAARATPDQLARFLRIQDAASPAEVQPEPRIPLTEREVQFAAAWVTTRKTSQRTEAEHLAERERLAGLLWKTGANFGQMIQYYRIVDSAPVEGGGFKPAPDA